jgi:superfamily II DNA or RNA helicase
VPGYFGSPAAGFSLVRDARYPEWRPAQRGAFGALLAHWSIHHRKPALVAIPTGSGKTAIAIGAAHLAQAHRVLVVVPSTQLRQQMVEAFSSEEVLRRCGALTGNVTPRVHEITGRVESWDTLAEYDVVVGLPQSISPSHYDENAQPPSDLFDLVLVDEAHHAPARTWRSILEHFDAARKLLLTATPRRTDGKRVPGDLIFHFPLRTAIAGGYYRVVEARVVNPGAPGGRDECDLAIRDAVVAEFNKPEHRTSTLLIRAGTRERVAFLVELYREVGIEVQALTSNLSDAVQIQIYAGLRDGTIRAVAVVGMLSEGFDLPRLRLAAYHDKHKSVASTIQLIGRLVRTAPEFPQPSVLVTANDADVYPALKGVLWDLYQEDAEWSELLPGIIDNEVLEDLADRAFSQQLGAPPAQLSLEGLRPLIRATVYEVADPNWQPTFKDGDLPAALQRGTNVRGEQIFYSTLTPSRQTLLLVTQKTVSPRWHAESGLDTSEFNLHLVTFVSARTAGARSLLLVNSGDGNVVRAIFEAIGTSMDDLRSADPQRLQRAFDTLPRLSVSNVGVRNTYGGGRGTASYKMFAGSGVDQGMRESDTAQSALGHAMAQVSEGPGQAAYNTGVAVEKSKVWESRYVPLRTYDEVLVAFADRYWSTLAVVNPLLPSVARGSRLNRFPSVPVAVVELHPVLLSAEWTLSDGFPVSRLDLRYVAHGSGDSQVCFVAVRPDTGVTIWAGRVGLFGDVHDDSDGVQLRRGGARSTLSEVLSTAPPALRFLDGHTVIGATIYSPPIVSTDLSRWVPAFVDWSSTNIMKETDASASTAGNGESVHETLRKHLAGRPSMARRRWILENDGSGELADLIVLELMPTREVLVELWHAKPSSGEKPSVRVTDMQVVVAQAIKSRRWLTDRGVFAEMGARLTGQRSPRLKIIEGSERLLRVLLGVDRRHPAWAIANGPYQPRGTVVIAQPGLRWSQLRAEVAVNDLSAIQIRDLLAVFDDALGALGTAEIVCSP